jgi:hypothetical protein
MRVTGKGRNCFLHRQQLIGIHIGETLRFEALFRGDMHSIHWRAAESYHYVGSLTASTRPGRVDSYLRCWLCHQEPLSGLSHDSGGQSRECLSNIAFVLYGRLNLFNVVSFDRFLVLAFRNRPPVREIGFTADEDNKRIWRTVCIDSIHSNV